MIARHNPRMPARALLVAALLAVGAAAAAPRPPDPASLVLRRADVGRSYAGRGGVVTDADAARGGPAGYAARLARWGRVTGYEIDFTRLANAATLQDGPLAVHSSASVYRSRAGAHAAFAYAPGQLVPGGYAPLPLGFAIGEEARQWVSQAASGFGTLLHYVLIWRERDVDASITITGRVGVVSAFDVASLARRQEARILAALGA
jgi:hypothetical protein